MIIKLMIVIAKDLLYLTRYKRPASYYIFHVRYGLYSSTGHLSSSPSLRHRWIIFILRLRPYCWLFINYQLSTYCPQNPSYCFISNWLYWVIILVWHSQFISILQSRLISSYPSPRKPNIFPDGNGIQFKISDTIDIWLVLDDAQGAQYLCRPKNLLAQHCPST